MKIPVVSLAILGGQIAAAAAEGQGQLAGSLNAFASYYTGFDFYRRQFDAPRLMVGYAPWILKRFILPFARPRLGGLHLPVSLS